MSVDTEAVANLLARSRQEHVNYRRALPEGPTPNLDEARAAMQRAYNLRVEAEALDPGRFASAWRSEPENFQHDACLAFYRAELGL